MISASSFRTRVGWVCLCLSLGAWLLPSPLCSQTPDPFRPGADSSVYALAVQADGKILVGGAFTKLGGQTRYGLGRLNPDGTLDPSFNPGNNSSVVYALALQPDNRILVAGSFSFLGGTPHRNIGRLNADGTLDPTFTTSVSNTVNCLALQPDGRILLGGSFKGISGNVRLYLGRLNADGSVDPGFNPGADNTPYSLALQPDGSILAGGRFTSLGGTGIPYLGRLSADGSPDLSFVPGPDNYVYSLAIQPDGRVVVGGRFTVLGGQWCNYIGRLNADGTLENTFAPGANNYVYAVALQADGKIVVGGSFTNLMGQPCARLGRLQPDGSLDTAFNAGASGTVQALALQADGRVLVTGSFTNLGGLATTNLGRLVNTAPADQEVLFTASAIAWTRGGTSPEVWRTTFDASTNGIDWVSLGNGTRLAGSWQLNGLTLPNHVTLRARGFTAGGQYNGSPWFTETIAGFPAITAQPQARTNNAGTPSLFQVVSLGSSATYQWRKGAVNLADGANLSGVHTPALVLSNVFGGDAGNYSVVISNTYGCVTSAVAALTVVDPVITNSPAGLLANAGQTVQLSVGAAGTALSFQWRKDGVALPGATSSSLTLTNLQWPDHGSYDVLVSSLYGSVTSAAARVMVNLAIVDATFAPAESNLVDALVPLPDGRILAAGASGRRLARFFFNGALDPTFHPMVNGAVWSLCLQPDSRILAAGSFTAIDGQPRSQCGRLNPDGSVDPTSDLDLALDLFAFALGPDQAIFLGGNFARLGSLTNWFYGIGRLNSAGMPDPTFSPPLAYGYVLSLAPLADGSVVVGGNLSRLGNQTVTDLGRIQADGSVDPLFLPATDGDVYALAVQPDGKILVGGMFANLGGQPRNRIGRLNADGSLDLSFHPALDGVGPSSGTPNYNQPFVSTIVLQADGRILVGGMFTNLCGEFRSCLGRLYPDGTLDPTFDPRAEGLDAQVNSLSLQPDGQILVGGQFASLAGVPGINLRRLVNTYPATQSLAWDGATITWLRGGACPEVGAVVFDCSTNGSLWLPLGPGTRRAGGWQLTGVGVPPNATVRARGFLNGGRQNDSSWYVETALGRPVITSQPAAQTNLAATVAVFNVLASGAAPLTYQWLKDGLNLQDGLNLSGSQTPTLSVSNVLRADAGAYSVRITNPSGSVTSLTATLTVMDPVITGQPISQAANPGQTVFFSVSAAGTALTYQWRKDGADLPGATESALVLPSLQAGNAGMYDVRVRNAFGTLLSTPVMLSVNTVVPDLFNPGAGGQVNSLAVQGDGRILVAGEFNTLGSSLRYYVGRLTPTGYVDSFNPLIDGYSATDVAVDEDGNVLAGGYFFKVNNQAHNRMARFRADGTLDTNFTAVAGDWLYCFAPVPGGQFLVGSTPEKLRRFNRDGSLDSVFNPPLSGPVQAAAMLPGGKILVGPSFASFKSLLRLNPDGSLDPAFNAPIDGPNTCISAIALQPDGKILIGGSFTNLCGQARTNFGRLNPDGSLDLSFQTAAEIYVNALALQTDGKIVVGGLFNSLGGQLRTNLARLNSDGTLDATFNPGANGTVNALALQADGSMVVGGSFNRLAGFPRNNLGRLNNTGPATQTLSFDGSDLLWLRGGTSPEVWLTTFAVSTNGSGTNWTDLGAGQRVPGGWRLANLNVPVTTNSVVRARGFVSGAQWFVEQTAVIGTNAPPKILTLDPGFGLRSNQFGFNVRSLPGQAVVVEASTNLTDWSVLATNNPATNLFYYSDPGSQRNPQRFYRARLR